MAASCPLGFDTARLRERVEQTYTRLAGDPAAAFHFHRGADYAVERLGYPRDQIDALPAVSVARFAGVGNPHCIGTLRRGAVVLDHACGAGMDLLIAARQVGPEGRAIGVDLTPAMRECAIEGARAAGLEGIVEIRAGTFESLPVEEASVDCVLSNGVVNLAPDKPRVFAEIARVLRPGGELWLADVVVGRELSAAVRSDAELWAACVGGAVTEIELLELVAGAGLVEGRVVRRFDCFAGTPVAARFGTRLEVGAVALQARRPDARALEAG